MKALSEKNNGIFSPSDLKKGHIKILYWALLALMLFICLICIFPPLWVILSSFSNIKDLLAVPPRIIPRSFNWRKLIVVWNQLNFSKFYINNIVMVTGDLTFCIIINGLAGYVISRLKPKGSSLYFSLILWTMLMPNSISMIPLFSTFLDFPLLHLNLSNTYLPMWLISGANPFYVLMFKSFFDSIPISYIESAKIDGYNNFSIFWRIIVPLSKPIMMVVSILTVNASWDNFLWPYLVLKDNALYTVTVKLFTMKTNGFPIDSQIVALLFAILPPSILFMIFQKNIVTGFSMSGIKG